MPRLLAGRGVLMGSMGGGPIRLGGRGDATIAGRPPLIASRKMAGVGKVNRPFAQTCRMPSRCPKPSPGVSLPAQGTTTHRGPRLPLRQRAKSLNTDPEPQHPARPNGFQFLGSPLKGLQRAGPHLPPRRDRDAAADAAAAAGDKPQAKKTFLGLDVNVWMKIVPLGLMFFCILFNYTILRDTKDVLVVTAPGSGAEIIPFLKTWVNLPMAIGFTILYAQLANVLSTEMLFYACIIPFIIFFWSFAFVLYPLRDFLHPTEFAKHLLAVAGPRFAGPIAILRNWTFCLFYVMAELWGSVVVSVLFWGFANQITSVDEATTFYPLFGLGANVALIFSGRAVKYFSQVRAGLPPGVDGWGLSLKGLMGMVVIGGLLIAGIYYWMNRQVVPNVPTRAAKKKKAKMSVGESFKFLANSKYIRNLATLVIAYGVSINLVEVTWKGKIKAQFPNPNDYSAFMGDFSSCTGAATLVMMLLSRFIFTRFGWGVAALITPTVLAITGALFFGLIIFGEPLQPLLSAINMTPLYLAVLVGAAQNIFSKSSKYSLFDPCKETAYIPLDDEVRTKGKAAIDVICNPLGKSGGAFIQQMLIISFGSLAACAPYLATIVIGVVIAWIFAAKSLDKQFTELQKEEMRAKLAEAKRELLQKAKAARSLHYTSKATEDGFAEGRWVAEGEEQQTSTTGTSEVETDPAPEPIAAAGSDASETSKDSSGINGSEGELSIKESKPNGPASETTMLKASEDESIQIAPYETVGEDGAAK